MNKYKVEVDHPGCEAIKYTVEADRYETVPGGSIDFYEDGEKILSFPATFTTVKLVRK